MDRVKNIINRLPKPLRNKYLLSLLFFIFWIIFLDDYNLINQHKIQSKVNELKQQKEFYLNEIEQDSTDLYQLKNNAKEQERFAREKFLMKKENEEVFIIRNKEDE